MQSPTDQAHAAHVPLRSRLRVPLLIAAAVSIALTSGCAVVPQPITPDEQSQRTDADLKAIFANQEPVAEPITLYTAMARALKYNLDRRVKLMEEAYAANRFDLSKFNMLPKLVTDLQRNGRNNAYGASSESLLTSTQSLEPSTSQDRYTNQANLTLVWNILDFGVSYVQAEQDANQLLIAKERRRKVVENILQDVRNAYWRAVAAEHLLSRIEPLMQQINQALQDAKNIEKRRLSAPLQALTYQRTLLDTLRQLQTLRQALTPAKARLAALMNLPPDQDFQLAIPSSFAPLPTLPADIAGLERYALLNRPELREAGYKTRISAEESRKALLRLLPGIEVDYGVHYDSNSFLYNSHWRQYGLHVTWNLMNIFSAKTQLNVADAQKTLTREQRLAMNMAVMTQVHVAYLNAGEAVHSYQIANELASVDGSILKQITSRAQARRSGRLELINSQLDNVIAELRRDMAYADANNAIGRVFVSIGVDALPDKMQAVDVKTLASELQRTMDQWYTMKLPHGQS